ncbi:MAG: hypothetical protein CVU90_13335 [Firmicutes bacterium HGW-Firmicutes-15]|nr:MAG: hypothetical protein CVU90_13335 [Firmicutes bacterium HGW-Firmicutes-15]
MEMDVHCGQETLLVIKRLYEDMLEISVRQKQLLESDQEISWSMDLMFELQDERQEIMQRIDELDSFFGSGSSSPDSLTNSTSGLATYTKLYREILLQMRSIIRAIEANDHSCQDRLEDAMQKMMSKLSQVKENKKAQVAYNQEDVYAPAWFFDKKQ